jgi:hypothetical protein
MPQKSFINKAIKKLNLPTVAKGALHNKYVLYFVFIVALFNLLREAVNQDYLYCVLFILIGFVTAFFNKNMIVILVIALALSAIIRAVLRGSGIAEGFQEGATGAKDDVSAGANDSTSAGASAGAKDSTSAGAKDASNNPMQTNSSATLESNSGSSLVGGAEKTHDKVKLIDNIKTDAVELMSVQNSIISGFQTIEPAMERAEQLIESIQTTAKTIDGLKQGMKAK